MTEQYIAELIRKYAQGIATDREVEQLMNWYRSSSINDVRWPSETKHEKDEVSGRMLNRLLKDLPARSKPVISMRWFRVAAILIPCISITLLLLLKPTTKQYITILNPSRQIQLVHLPDGSLVWLNASTTLQYRKSFINNREVVLDGEAFFDVRRDLEHPFTINGGDAKTTVLGTSFNVKAYGSDTVTYITVVTGRVGVETGSAPSTTLTPSSQFQFDRVKKIATTSLVDTSGALAWTKGKFLFEGKSLAEIAKSIEQWYGVSIVFKSTAMKNCRYYMSFENTLALDTLLSTMSEITRMKYNIDRSRNIVELSGQGCE